MEKHEFLELTNPQKSIWLIEQYYKGSNINNVCGVANIYEKIDFEALQKAINILIKNNSSFLINFKMQNGKLVQYKTNYTEFNIEIVDLNTPEDLEELKNSLINRVFEIENSYLFEFKIFRYPDNTGGLILNIHHLLSDSWTFGLACKRAVEIYNSLITNNSSEYNCSDYFNFCIAEHEYIESSKFEKDKEYWESLFETVPEIASIPSKKITSEKLSCKGNRKTFEISKDLVAKINDYCKNNRISNFNFITGLYSLYLSRVCNLDDFVIGTPILNRTDFVQKNTTGMFVSTVPLRVNVNNEASFSELTSSIAKNSMSLLRHQKYPYEFLLKKLREKDANLPNLYNILISYQITNTVADGLNYSTSWAFNGNCADELQIHILDINDTGNLSISYDYKVDKYDEDDIESLHKRVEYIANQVLSSDSILVKEIQIVTPEEKDLILNKFNNTFLDYPKDRNIIDMFEEQVEINPDKIAIIFEDQSITYRELNEKANQLANYLIENGINYTDTVGILQNRSLEMAISLIAVLKTGAHYLPIDPEYPIDRIQYMLQDSSSSILLINNSTEVLDINIEKIINVNLNSSIYMNSDNIYNIKNIINQDSLVYLLYTSGSTGQPKGVMITHKNIYNFLYGVKQKIDFSSNKTMLSVTTISFDIFELEFWGALTSGLKLVIANEKEQFSLTDLRKLCEKNKIDMIQTTPSRYSALLASSNDLNFLNNFTDILIGGESLPELLVEKIQNFSNAKIYNMYGPTETTVWSTIKQIDNKHSITIGKPIINTTCYILDKSCNLLPPYVPGTLYIGGDGVSLGYWNKKDLTKEKFIKSTFNKNETIYNTGDLAYFTKSGELIHLGRVDFQVKIRGYRIELSEIEEKILEYGGIQNCVVNPVENSQKLAVYYTSDSDINLDNLKIFLLDCLPNYMVPNYYIKISELPYTPNGKINRKALAQYKLSDKSLEKKIPTTKIEKEIYNIISNIINTNNFGITDDFFSIGLDSLSIIKLTSIIQENYGIEINSSQIYKLINIQELSHYVSTANNTQSKKIIKKTNFEYYPLSSAQKRIYYATKMSNNPLLYNICGGLLVKQILDEKKIKDVFKKIICNHSAFRTCFKIINDEPKQIVLNNISLRINTYKNRDTEPKDIIDAFPKKFNFEHAPLLRVEVHYLDCQKTLILIDSHHIILDGTSLEIILKEFCDLYNGKVIEPEKIEYKDYTIWEKDLINSDQMKQIEENWIEAFTKKEIPVINLPYDHPHSQANTFNGDTLSTKIDKETFEKVSELAKKHKISPNIFFLSVLYILLYKYTGQERIIIGIPMSGRFNHDLENTIGMFVNNLPIVKQINPDIPFASFINEVKNKIINSLADGIYPYDMFTKALNLGANSSLFDVMFIYQSESTKLPKIENHTIKVIPATTKTAKYNLSMEIIPSTKRLNIEFNTDLFEKTTISNIMKHYLYTLKFLTEHMYTKISSIEILSDEEKHKILYEFNNTKMQYNPNISIAQLFENAVKKENSKTALIFGDTTLTFKELDEKSNELANYLRKQKITNNDIIGIMLERSPELIVSILAALKCGCCYIPIDPQYPVDRIKYMLGNSNSKILLTTKKTYLKTDFHTKLVVNFDNANVYNGQIDPLNNITSPDDNAYMIYTSGSTGVPKGVLLKQKSLTNLACHLNNTLDFFKSPKNVKMCSITTASFDIFLFETIICLQAGITIVLANEDEQRIPSKLNALLEKNNVNAIQMTPSRMQFFLENLQDIEQLKKIKYVTLAGEPLSANLVSALRKIGVKKVYNGYGPSETTVFSTFTDVTNQKIITIGKPLSNTQIYILDKDNQPCPIGVAGELHIAGDGVGNGYLDNIELTQNKYIKNPFLRKSVMYKVGDLCKFTDSGDILCLGRIDNQIKIRGLRIELDEIENKILEFPNIKSCTVVKQVFNNREFISAYYIAKKRISKSELRSFLAKSLPDYMIPSYFTPVAEFPHTPNGKIDKKALPLPTISNDTNYVAPKTDLEIKLANIYANLLNTSPIGIFDNFFELGGDSILAMKLNIELLKIYDKITYADIFKNPTIFDLVKLIQSTDSQDDNMKTIKIDNSKYEPILNKNVFMPDNISQTNYKNILLTGSTGFLGIHILSSYIEKTTANIYCIIRDEPGIDAHTKLMNKLNYYFGDKYNNLINKRIFIITGDITQEKFGLSNSEYEKVGKNIDCVINSAAKVDHFGQYKDFYNTNVLSVQYLIDLCKKYKKKLFHISTLSVSGNAFVDSYWTEQTDIEESEFRENNFYIGQRIDNVYVKTKFEAEQLMLDSILSGLDGYILRVGNLMPRFSDGVFQENYSQNAYLNRLSAFLQLKCVPESIEKSYLEFTPIDYCADSIVKITENCNTNNRIFHLFNHNHVTLKELLILLKYLNYTINIMPDENFKKLIKEIIDSQSQNSVLDNLVNDFGQNLDLNYTSNITIKSDFTINYLKNLDFIWPTIDLNYIEYILKIIERR